jgi:serine/threonine-protein kinase
MELVDGRALADVLSRGALPWRSAALIGTQVAAALAAAHARGIVHRDVKPSNVMVTSGGVKLVDFGISATVGEADRIGGEVIGTPAYLAPERLGGSPVRPATDVYAMGLLLYLMLAGRLPWQASTTTEMLRAHRYLEPAGLPPVGGLPHEVADLCERCLAKDPADRPGADEVARILATAAGLAPAPTLLDGLDGEWDEHAAATVAMARGRRLRRPLLAASAAAALLATGSVLWFGARPDDPGVQAAAAGPAAAPQSDVECTVGYAIRSALNGRFSTAVTIANTGGGAARDWHLTFVLPDGQKLVRGWDGDWKQDGQSLAVRGSGLAPGGRVFTGFDASYRGATTLPGQFRLNGTVCTAEMSVTGATTPPPTTTPVTAAKVTKTGKSSGGGSGSGSGGNKGEDRGKGGDDGKGNGKGKGKGKGKD